MRGQRGGKERKKRQRRNKRQRERVALRAMKQMVSGSAGVIQGQGRGGGANKRATRQLHQLEEMNVPVGSGGG